MVMLLELGGSESVSEPFADRRDFGGTSGAAHEIDLVSRDLRPPQSVVERG